MYRYHFLLTQQIDIDFPLKRINISNFYLFYHPELNYTYSKSEKSELYLLGALYDWKQPEQTNQQILDTLSLADSLNVFLKKLSRFAGTYVIVFKSENDFILLHDAGGQKEIYYDTDFSSFGSQPNILNEVIKFKQYKSLQAIELYSSVEFSTKKLFVGTSTHVENVKHLLPNHYIDLRKKIVKRYFPNEPIIPMSTNEVAHKACKMLKGYIKAISLRENIAMAVTGGYDSRVLFLSSLDLECKYFVSQHSNMSDKHYDITISQQLAQMYGKLIEVIPDKTGSYKLSESINFPNPSRKPGKYFDNHLYLNGNISEIARNYYGYFKNITATDLALFSNYSKFKFAEEEYQHWLKDVMLFEDNGYNVLDMFYWEEKIGVWAAKTMTMMLDVNRMCFSPYCSRELLVTLLSCPREDRDKNINKLYNKILLELSPKALDLPINPCLKSNCIRSMTRVGVYNIYRNIGLKYQFLNF